MARQISGIRISCFFMVLVFRFRFWVGLYSFMVKLRNSLFGSGSSMRFPQQSVGEFRCREILR